MNLEIIGEGKTTKVYRDGDIAIKLYTHATSNEAYNEAERQTFAVNNGLPVPYVIGVKHIPEGVALEMAYIKGSAIINPNMDRTEMTEALNRLVELQCAVQCVNAAGQPRLYDRLVWRISNTSHLGADEKNVLLTLLNSLESGKTHLCHGDFHPLNIIKGDTGYWIIDWVDAACGDPLADACRSYLLFRTYISNLSEEYLDIYCKKTMVNRHDVLAWLPVLAAARLFENLGEKEFAFTMGIIRDGIAHTALR